MNKSVWLLGCATLLLAACDTLDVGQSDPSSQFINELPEGVLAVAAPYQNLKAVKIDPSNGCYIYRYAGPVETTLLPLRTVEGQPICTAKPDASPEESL